MHMKNGSGRCWPNAAPTPPCAAARGHLGLAWPVAAETRVDGPDLCRWGSFVFTKS